MYQILVDKLLNNEQISIDDILYLCELKDIKIGARTKGFLHLYIKYIQYISETKFEIFCTHENAKQPDYILPAGIVKLIDDLYNKIIKYELKER